MRFPTDGTHPPMLGSLLDPEFATHRRKSMRGAALCPSTSQGRGLWQAENVTTPACWRGNATHPSETNHKRE